MLIKVHVSGGDDAVRDRIIAAIAFGVSRVTKKDTWNGARGEFVRGGGGCTRVAVATENAKTVVERRRPEKEVVWCVVPAGATRADID